VAGMMVGVKMRKIDIEKEKEITKYYQNNICTLKEIEKIFYININTVRNILRRNNIEIK
jgi:DNA-binding CsgD family transcriptional regulator